MRGGVLVAAWLTGCVNDPPYRCTENVQCVSDEGPGMCELPQGYCSFPDPACPSGWRWADNAEGSLARHCVSVTPADASQLPDGGIDAAARLTPSNGADVAWLDDVTAGLHVMNGENWVMNTMTGEIVGCGGAVIRPAGEGLMAGIHFARLPAPPEGAPIGAFAIDALQVDDQAQLYGLGDGALLILVRTTVLVTGLIEASGGARACDLAATCGSATGSRQCAGPGGFVGGSPGAGLGPGGGGSLATALMAVGGGGGGGFAAQGGSGGGGTLGAPRGAAYGTMRLEPLVGGSGGGGSAADGAARAGGGGGGALQITALGSIEIGTFGRISAGGAGGEAGGAGGGGGGGAGGGVLLEAPVLRILGRITSNGAGGGGSGAASTDGMAGTFGPFQAPGGAGPLIGGSGGARNGPPGENGQPITDMVGASSGGGGGVGRLVLRYSESVDQTAANLSPEPLVLQDLIRRP